MNHIIRSEIRSASDVVMLVGTYLPLNCVVSKPVHHLFQIVWADEGIICVRGKFSPVFWSLHKESFPTLARCVFSILFYVYLTSNNF